MSTIDKALDILEMVNSNDEEINLTNLARLNKSNKSTIYRICSTLVKRGYLRQKSKGKYSLGYKFLQYCNRKNVFARIKDESYPFLQMLCNETSESVILSILDGISVTEVTITPTERMLQVVPKPGMLPFHCTAGGKVLLAYLHEQKKETIIDSIQFNVFTNNTIVDVNLLRKEIEKIKSEGVAFDKEEYIGGVQGIAAPVIDDTGEAFAAVSLIGPSIRINESKYTQLIPLVKHYALLISRALGYMIEQ